MSSALQTLDAEALLAAAVAQTGLEDFGNGGFREGFESYVAALGSEARLTAAGVAAQREFIHKNLVNRLRFEADRKQHPEIAAEPVDDPIFIVGLPRTGTTKIMRMLSADPAAQALPYWSSLNPAPFPGWVPGQPDPRIALAREQDELMQQVFPEFWAFHSMAAEQAEEEIILHDYSFQSPALAMRSGTYTTYLGWLQSHDPELRACHEYARELLRYLQWQRGGRRGPWILKNVVSFGYLPTLFKVYPKATLVQCHRDVRVCVASTLKLFELARGAFTMNSDFDLIEHGRIYLDYYSGLASRNVAQREALRGKPIIDVGYEDICNDPYAVITAIHALRGEMSEPQAAAPIRQWEEKNPQHRYGKVAYSLERYGIDAQDVDRAFAPYTEYFPLSRAK